MDLVQLLILAIVAFVAYYIIGLIPLPDPFHTIALILLGLAVLFWLLDALGLYRFPRRY